MKSKIYNFILWFLIILSCSCFIGYYIITKNIECLNVFGIFGTICATCFSAFYQVAAITNVNETLTTKENDIKDIKDTLHKINDNSKRTFAVMQDSNGNLTEGFIWSKNDYELQDPIQVIIFKNEEAFDRIKKSAFVSHPKYHHQCEIIDLNEKEKSITVKL